MGFRLFFCVLFLTACASAVRAPSSAEPGGELSDEQKRYEDAVRELTQAREARRPLVSHEKHLPVIAVRGHRTDTVVVLLHGLFESPFYVKGLRRNFEARGYNVVAPLLAKHWAIPQSDLNKADYREWIEQAVSTALLARSLGKKVLVAGHSTGGLLAVYLAINHPELVDGLMLWSPALALSYYTYYSSLLGTLTQKPGSLDYNHLAGKPPFHPENVPYYTPFAGREVMRLEDEMYAEYLKRQKLPFDTSRAFKTLMYKTVKVPTLLIEPKIDAVVSSNEMSSFFFSIAGPKVRYALDGEEHTSTPKDSDDYYPGAQVPNKNFPGMIEKVNRFLDQYLTAP